MPLCDPLRPQLYPTALALVESGKIDLKPLISRRFPLAAANSAFEFFATGEPIKVIITPNEAAPDDGQSRKRKAEEDGECEPCS